MSSLVIICCQSASLLLNVDNSVTYIDIFSISRIKSEVNLHVIRNKPIYLSIYTGDNCLYGLYIFVVVAAIEINFYVWCICVCMPVGLVGKCV